ncbi:MAG: DUF309 domain-containing protein [Trichodesmium sp. St16_bin2-tuft]|jgi:predicted metal-dependent hydrolase|nr:DUF309 domain-containing protein [Trichodesmium sp. MAG_R02]MDE5084384.1 DUF309 domain-containing protein [Trichodesmium sp. St18_bin1]MDE5087212.1 DUF309 domain-containing protein [Trichodesmium sp. St16_bin2-tuft]MDE5109115.1 DUF309 domain-containing protein [Trichodesmium sp. St17_bin3_1_1]MDE5124636.1 DUF309 domain-containing protein [Trichodesmium sp. St19_bin1]
MTSEQEKIPQEFWQGIREFNEQEFYKCHDTLEGLWLEAGEPERTFYQGILQIAVGLYHVGNENWLGSVMLLGEGISKLNYYHPNYFGINVDNLLIESSELLKDLQNSGKEKITNFGPSSQNSKYPKILKLKD